MSYIKKIINLLKEIIVSHLFMYLIIFISCILYKIFINNNLKYFINNQLQYISILSIIIITSYLYKHNKRKESKLIFKNIPLYISIGISLSCFLNMIIFKIFPPTIKTNNISIIFIISSCLIGPLYEEILFRYIFLNKLKTITTPLKTIIINSIIFSIIHLNIKEIIFSFPLSIIICIIYQKNNNIKSPIIIHSAANIISIFLKEYNTEILLLSIICLLINREIIKNIN